VLQLLLVRYMPVQLWLLLISFSQNMRLPLVLVAAKVYLDVPVHCHPPLPQLGACRLDACPTYVFISMLSSQISLRVTAKRLDQLLVCYVVAAWYLW
jgi:hypothetical protein